MCTQGRHEGIQISIRRSKETFAPMSVGRVRKLTRLRQTSPRQELELRTGMQPEIKSEEKRGFSAFIFR
jgi:hypothetical protein